MYLARVVFISTLLAQAGYASSYLSPIESVGLSSANQYQITLNAAQTLNSLVANFYSGASCSGTPSASVTMPGGSSALTARTYVSTNASNYALCQRLAGGCSAAAGYLRIQFVYTFSWGSFTGNCISAHLANSLGTNCTSSSDCSYNAPAVDTLNNSGKLFVSITSSQGSFTQASADTICMTNAQSASLSGTYSALFATSSLAWNVMPSVNYYNAYNGTQVTSSDATGLFGTRLTANILQADGGGARGFWTGYGGTNVCSNWTDNTSGSEGQVGYGFSGVDGWYNITANNCSSFNNFLCVSYNAP